MAYKSFNQRFPKFKLVLLVAILITLSLTVFSAQQRTSTEQHASTSNYVCGPNNSGPVCPSGYTCSFTAGNPTFGGTCINNNPAPVTRIPTAVPYIPPSAGPTGLTAHPFCQGNISRVTFKWNKLSAASTYKVVWSGYITGPITSSTTYSTPSNHPLTPGNHTWKIRGESGNYGYPTKYSKTADFTALNCAPITAPVTPTSKLPPPTPKNTSAPSK